MKTEEILRALAEGAREYEEMPSEDKRTFVPYKLRWAMERAQEWQASQALPKTPERPGAPS
jgi:hypothetical protein